MSRLLGSAGIDVERQFPVFSDRTPPLFRQTAHIVDQSDQVTLINSYPLFFPTLFETGRLKRSSASMSPRAFLQFSSQTARLSPLSCSSLAVSTLAAMSCSSTINFSGSMKQEELYIPYFFHCPFGAFRHKMTNDTKCIAFLGRPRGGVGLESERRSEGRDGGLKMDWVKQPRCCHKLSFARPLR
jgi:hypothetical protein